MQHIYDLEMLAGSRQAELIGEAQRMRQAYSFGKHPFVPRLAGLRSTFAGVRRYLRPFSNLPRRRSPQRVA